jgi:hypothetical protein
LLLLPILYLSKQKTVTSGRKLKRGNVKRNSRRRRCLFPSYPVCPLLFPFPQPVTRPSRPQSANFPISNSTQAFCPNSALQPEGGGKLGTPAGNRGGGRGVGLAAPALGLVPASPELPGEGAAIWPGRGLAGRGETARTGPSGPGECRPHPGGVRARGLGLWQPAPSGRSEQRRSEGNAPFFPAAPSVAGQPWPAPGTRCLLQTHVPSPRAHSTPMPRSHPCERVRFHLRAFLSPFRPRETRPVQSGQGTE